MLPFVLLLLTGCPGFGSLASGSTEVCATFNIPEVPTWDAEVEGVMASNCSYCHMDPPASGAPDYFVLDSYEDTVGDDGRDLLGAHSQQDRILGRAIDGDPSFMPLGSSSGPSQEDKCILSAWVEQGAPLTGDDTAGAP